MRSHGLAESGSIVGEMQCRGTFNLRFSPKILQRQCGVYQQQPTRAKTSHLTHCIIGTVDTCLNAPSDMAPRDGGLRNAAQGICVIGERDRHSM
mmetsp:Transcript_21840/g.65276  ORF Transcript_21840/g.65276 Transcript_21840/m.65276 type:complete len:94 (+) Transcript_21840:1287-1568(+)